jgi:antitoxin component YwqK of YwqJK toxin-antitoxin module
MTNLFHVVSRGSWALALAAVAAGCGGGKSSTKGDKSEEDASSERLAENIRQSKQGNEKVTEFDLNHDKKPDVWSYTVPAKTEDGKDFDRLVRKELDINWDGKVDISRFYTDKEQIEKEALDLDFDGKVDQVNFYEKGVIVRKERDLDYNGKPDLFIFYEKGKIVRKERDQNGDGKIDYWEYWEADQVDRIGEDLDGDGNVDKWTKNPNSES